MQAKSARLRVWLLAATAGLLLAAICFVALGLTHTVSPVTAIGNVSGFLVTSFVTGFFALRK